MNLGDGIGRIGCESCGRHVGCVCDQLVQCIWCGNDFLPPHRGDGNRGLCNVCIMEEEGDD